MKNFSNLCDQKLNEIAEAIELKDKNSQLDVEYADGILTIITLDSKTYIINRHSASQKIWYSSPISGADYFSFDDESNKWINSNNKELSEKLFAELDRLL